MRQTRFSREARAVVDGATIEAGELGSRTVEAEHILLAIARRETTPAGELLAAAGLDHAGVREALGREVERSLRAVGIEAADFPVRPHHSLGKRPRPAESFKLAFHRGARIALDRRDRRIVPLHLLLGALAAPVGTVPRALDAAGVDADALRAAAHDALSRPTAGTG